MFSNYEKQCESDDAGNAIFAYLIAIPVFKELVFANGPEIMGIRAFFKGYLHYTFVMGENRFVAIPEVQAPNLDILVRRACRDELGVI